MLMFRIMPACSLVATLSVFHLVAAQPTERTAEAIDVGITLRRLDDLDWLATFRFDPPISAVDFHEPIGAYRETSWRLEEAFVLGVERGHEVLRHRAGNPFTEVSIRIRSEDRLWSGYEPFNLFSDGGASAYTGYFTFDAYIGDTPQETALSFDFIPRAGESVIVDGVRSAQVSGWQPIGQRQGSFIYFGSAATVETADMLGVVDPEVPSWFRSDLERTLPSVFEYLRQKFRAPLFRKPTVFVSARFRDGVRGYDVKAGARPEQLQFRLRGDALLAPSPELRADLLFNFVHEAVHLWQPVSGSREASWIHEGAADALALEAVKDLTIWSDSQVAAKQEVARTRCARALAQGSLAHVAANDSGDAAYACGLVVFMATARVLAPHQTGLFEFWSELADGAASAGGELTMSGYIAALDAFGVEAQSSTSIRSFVEDHHVDPVFAIDGLLGGAPQPLRDIGQGVR